MRVEPCAERGCGQGPALAATQALSQVLRQNPRDGRWGRRNRPLIERKGHAAGPGVCSHEAAEATPARAACRTGPGPSGACGAPEVPSTPRQALLGSHHVLSSKLCQALPRRGMQPPIAVVAESLLGFWPSCGSALPARWRVSFTRASPVATASSRRPEARIWWASRPIRRRACSVLCSSPRKTAEGRRMALEANGWGIPVDMMDAEGEVLLPAPKGVHLQEKAVGTASSVAGSLFILPPFKGHAMCGFGRSLRNNAIGWPRARPARCR